MAKVLCMQIGEHIVRLAEVQANGKKTAINKIYTFDVPDEATKDGKVRVSDEVVTAIRAGLIESDITAKDVYFTVESTRILFKSVEIPMVAKKMIQSTLDLSITDLFNIDDSLYHIAYVQRGVIYKNEQKMLALEVFAIPNDISESYYNLAVALGLSPKGVVDTSHSVLTLLNEEFQNRNVATINLEETTATLAIITNGEMVYHKTIPHGMAPAIEMVRKHAAAQGGDLDYTESVEQLYTNNILLEKIPEMLLDKDEDSKTRYDTTLSLSKLIKNIDLSFTQFLQKEQNIKIQEIVITGLGGGIANISKLMAREFNVTVKVFQQGQNISINKAIANEVLLISSFPLAGAASDSTNFFTPSEKAGGEVVRKKQMDSAIAIAGTVIMAVGGAYGAYTLFQANLKYNEANKEHTRLERHVQELRDLGVEAKFAAYTTAFSYNEEIKNLYKETESINDDMTIFLSELERHTPVGATVIAIKMTPSSAEVTYTCNNQYIAAGTLHLLRNMKTITSMECTGVGEDTDGTVNFVAKFILKSAEELNGLLQEDADFANSLGIETETEPGAESDIDADEIVDDIDNFVDEPVDEMPETEPPIVIDEDGTVVDNSEEPIMEPEYEEPVENNTDDTVG